MDQLISHLTKDPLLVRHFLQSLDRSDKAHIYHTVRAPALKSFFARVLQETDFSIGTEKPQRDKVFERILKDLERYMQVHRDMVAKPFGYMAMLSGRQIAQYIGTQTDRVSTLKVLAPYLDDFHLRDVTQALSISEKAAFMSALAHREGPASHSSAVSERDRVNADLRQIYDEQERLATVDSADPEMMEQCFLENDRDSVEVIKELGSRDSQILRRYERYLIGFEDFLGLDLGIARKVMQKTSNETICRALYDRDIDENLKRILGDMRSQLIVSLKQRGDAVRQEEMETARNEILRLYRSHV